jgi:two-component system, OmpR family, alkaline phosphatase synthesis response regulator PhoP
MLFFYFWTMIKIVLADDDPDILEMMEYNLTKEGYVVICAQDGEEAIRLVDEHKPELVVLDIMMPKKDGVEVCGVLRAKPELDNVMIVFLTARSEDYTQIACYDNGADDYIVKPIKPRVLVSRIKGILRRKTIQNGGGQPITFKDIEIDLDKYLVKKSGQEIMLAKKEFDLLVLLSSRTGKLFTRDEIFNKVWGVDQMTGDRTIDVHIRKLREKIGNDYIKTVKGVGYRMEA